MINGFLDTNVIIDILAGYPPAIRWFNSVKSQQLAIHPVVWMEVVRGSRNRSEQVKITGFLSQFSIEHPTPDDNYWAFSHFWLSDRIGWEDCIIASVSVRLSLPIYTINIKHYKLLANVNVQRPY